MKKVDPKGKLSWLTYLSDYGGVGYIRSIVPNMLMGCWRHQQMSFEPTQLTSFIPNPEFYRNFAFVKFQRSATKQQLDLIKYIKSKICKQTGTSIIYEVDDMLFNIPESNFASKYYQQNKPYIEEMLYLVDGITVSTAQLKKEYKKYNKNISIVKNRLAKCLWGDIKEYQYQQKDKLRIVYPGSQNHFNPKAEGGDIQQDLLKYITDTKKDKFEWVFIGGIPYELKDDPDITYINWIDYMSYPSVLKNINADIGIAPLEINDFNRSKSNIKMQEYTVSGIPAVYTDIEPYKQASLRSKTETDMINNIEWLSEDSNRRYETWKKDCEYVKKGLFFENNRLNWINEHMKLFDRMIK